MQSLTIWRCCRMTSEEGFTPAVLLVYLCWSSFVRRDGCYCQLPNMLYWIFCYWRMFNHQWTPRVHLFFYSKNQEVPILFIITVFLKLAYLLIQHYTFLLRNKLYSRLIHNINFVTEFKIKIYQFWSWHNGEKIFFFDCDQAVKLHMLWRACDFNAWWSPRSFLDGLFI